MLTENHPHIELNGKPATVDGLAFPALNNDGHFTAMQVRGHAVRGLSVHLDRLTSATRELFDAELDLEEVRAHVRHALGDTADAAVRVYVYWPGEPLVMVVVRPPHDLPADAQRLGSVPYQRPMPHVKHVGGFGQRRALADVARRGCDDALLTTPDGEVAETAIANVGFLRGSAVVWPSAPMLTGTTMRLLDDRLAASGTPSRAEPIRLPDVGSFDGAFVANSTGIAPVATVDDVRLPAGPAVARLRELYESVPWTGL